MTRYDVKDLINNRFLVDHVLLGGFGEVYLCRDLRDDEYPIALKTFVFGEMRLSQNYKLLLALKREAAVWTSLGDHPNIVKCFYMLPTDNQFFLFLERIENSRFEGSSLRGLLNVEGCLAPQEAMMFTLDICRGLEFAQQKMPGFIHRDLKPENILIDEDDIAKITDFGMAKVVDHTDFSFSGKTGSSSEFRFFVSVSTNKGNRYIYGTPTYMALEQCRDEPLDIRTDIYAVGCILYEMLTGAPPFNDDDLGRLIELHKTGTIPNLPVSGTLSKQLNSVIKRCLSKKPEDRYRSFAELSNELIEIYKDRFKSAPRIPEFKYPDDGRDSTNSGITLTYEGDYSSALKFHNTAVVNSPFDPRVYINRGMTLHFLGASELAMDDFNRAGVLNSSYDKAYYHRGIMYFERGKFEEAEADFKRAISLAPEYALAYTNLGQTMLEQGQLEDALHFQMQALTLDPTLVPAYVHRAITLMKLNRLEEAERDFVHACKLDPLDKTVHLRLGVFYERRKKYLKAMDCFETGSDLGCSDAKRLLESVRQKYLSGE